LNVTLELLGLAAVGLVAIAGGRQPVTAAMRYLLATLLGSGAYLLGVALIYGTYASVSLAVLAPLVSAGAPLAVTLAAALMLLGLMLKTALFPFHFWLPPAHGGAPAPVSALLSALVIKATLYLVLRLWLELFAPLTTVAAAQLLGILGAAAILWGSLLALTQSRLKMLVAYSTVAQVGYLFLLFPLATLVPPGVADSAVQGGVMQAVAHGLAKAAMFAAAGSMIVATGRDDISRLGGVGAAAGDRRRSAAARDGARGTRMAARAHATGADGRRAHAPHAAWRDGHAHPGAARRWELGELRCAASARCGRAAAAAAAHARGAARGRARALVRRGALGHAAAGRARPCRRRARAGPSPAAAARKRPHRSPVRDAAHAFNAMQARLVRFIDDRARVLGAMSHDLKTPLTRLRLRAELLEDEDLRARFEKDLTEMEAMVAGTLDFMHGLGTAEARQPVDVMALIESIQADCEEMGGEVRVEGTVREPYVGNPALLRRSLVNLIDNAIRYGKRARVSVQDGADALTVRVLDEGPGIAPQELENVFGAALDAGRTARIVQRLQGAADHPVDLAFPEGEYLKGLLLQVD